MQTTDHEPSAVEISIVVPLFNEVGNVAELHSRLTQTLEGTGRPYEIILIDDGSTDGTRDALDRVCEQDPHVVAIRLRRNFGQTAALAAGFDHARGDIIISMDGDLQHEPKEIPRFLEKLDEGYDIVSGWRQDRPEAWLTRRIPSLIANKIMALLSGVALHDFGTTFKAYRKEVIENIHLFGDLHRFVPALASRIGAEIAEIPIECAPRKSGSSKYNLKRVPRVLFDLITVKYLISYLASPLRVFGSMALLSFGSGFGISAILLVLYLCDPVKLSIREQHMALLIFSAILMIMGMQLITMGLSAEISARVYHAVRNQPIYVIREIVRKEAE